MISIIIPVFDDAKNLDECLESIKKQTYNNYEIIIVDDGSKDNVKEVYEKHKVDFGLNLIFTYQDHEGAPAARNNGLAKAQGEYILFCDSDSILKPEMIKTMLETLKNNETAAYAYSSFLWGRKLFRLNEFSDDKLKEAPCIHTMSLIRKSALDGINWDPKIKKLQDWDLWLSMLEKNNRGKWIDKVLFQIKPGGTISTWVPSFFYKLFPFLKAVKKYKEAVDVVKEKHNL